MTRLYIPPAYLTSMQSIAMRNAGQDVSQAAIKIAGRNINSLRYADDTTLKAEREEGTKELLDEGQSEE